MNIPSKPASFKTAEHYKGWREAVHAAHDAVVSAGGSVERFGSFVGQIGSAFIRNATGGDIKKILKK